MGVVPLRGRWMVLAKDKPTPGLRRIGLSRLSFAAY